MWKPKADVSRPRRRLGLCRVGLALMFILPTGVVSAAAQEGDLQAARQALEARYDILPVRGGAVLRPLEPAAFESLELRAGVVSVDGHAVEERGLESLVGEQEAGVLLTIAALGEEEIRALFEFPPRPPAPAPTLPDSPRDRASALEEELETRMEEMARRMEERAQRAEERAREADRRAERRQRSGGDTRVTMGGAIHVLEGEISGDVVSIGGAVTVDGEVLGDAVAVGGPVRVRGRVTGDVVSVGGGVRLEPTAEVLGEVVTIGGRLQREPGARVLGEVTEVSFMGGFLGPLLGRSLDWEWRWDRHDYFRGSVTRLLGNLTRMLALAVVGALLLVLAPGPVTRVAARIERQPLMAGAVGFTTLLLYGPAAVLVTVLLAVSVLGIPLILLVLFSIPAFFAMALFGYVAAACSLGRWSERRFRWRLGAPLVAFLVGILFLHGWGVVADLINVADGPHNVLMFLVMIFGLFGFFLKLSAWSMGLGGIILSWREGRRGGAVSSSPIPEPPVPPGTPPRAPGLAGAAGGGGAALHEEPAPEAPAEKDSPEARREWNEPWPEEDEGWPRADPSDQPQEASGGDPQDESSSGDGPEGEGRPQASDDEPPK